MKPGIIERALELAPECDSVLQLRQKLRAEGYEQVDQYLAGKSFKKQIVERLMPTDKKRRVR
jgi:hypothetical protein